MRGLEIAGRDGPYSVGGELASGVVHKDGRCYLQWLRPIQDVRGCHCERFRRVLLLLRLCVVILRAY